MPVSSITAQSTLPTVAIRQFLVIRQAESSKHPFKNQAIRIPNLRLRAGREERLKPPSSHPLLKQVNCLDTQTVAFIAMMDSCALWQTAEVPPVATVRKLVESIPTLVVILSQWVDTNGKRASLDHLTAQRVEGPHSLTVTSLRQPDSCLGRD